jgi:hypothetical protein
MFLKNWSNPAGKQCGSGNAVSDYSAALKKSGTKLSSRMRLSTPPQKQK